MRAGQQHAMIWLSSAERRLAELIRGWRHWERAEIRRRSQTVPIDLRQLQRPTASL